MKKCPSIIQNMISDSETHKLRIDNSQCWMSKKLWRDLREAETLEDSPTSISLSSLVGHLQNQLCKSNPILKQFWNNSFAYQIQFWNNSFAYRMLHEITDKLIKSHRWTIETTNTYHDATIEIDLVTILRIAFEEVHLENFEIPNAIESKGKYPLVRVWNLRERLECSTQGPSNV